MKNAPRRLAALGAAALLAASPLAATADTTPAHFPEGAGLDATAYTLRLAGDDRFATAATLARVAALHDGTTTGWPFNEADRTEPSTSYGFASCPKTVGIAAGDTVADALAAAPLKDLAGLTIDGVTLDTTNAVLLLTTSGRQGATDLAPTTIRALQALKEACGGFDGVIFGSEVAVPANAATTFDALSEDVVRIEGQDRFATAAAVADAVATVGLPTVDVHSDAATKQSMPNTVILAEAFTGADALAVGPFAAARNVPVLLTAGDELPIATRNALLALAPDTILVLGGQVAVPDAVVDQAVDAANGATPVRIAGTNRYDTSVLVAQRLHGIFPPDVDPVVGEGGESLSNQALGLARSEGARGEHLGFPDALASAWFLDTFNTNATAPARLAPAVERNADTVTAEGTTRTTIGGQASPLPAPLLLTAAGELVPEVGGYVADLYPDADAMRTARNPDGVNDGGFGFVFGGAAAVTDEAALELAEALSGGTYVESERTDLAPTLDAAKVFYTAADLSGVTTSGAGGVDAEGAVAAGDKVCVDRAALTGAQWLALYEGEDAFAAALAVDYQDEAGFPAAQSRLQCVDATAALDAADVLGISLSGHRTSATTLDWADPADRIATLPGGEGEDVTADTATGDPTAGVSAVPGSSTASQTFSGTASMLVRGTTYETVHFTLELDYRRTNTGAPDGPDRVEFTGVLAVRTTDGATLFSAPLDGESATTTSELRLVAQYRTTTAAGAFLATVTKTGSSFALTGMVVDGLV